MACVIPFRPQRAVTPPADAEYRKYAWLENHMKIMIKTGQFKFDVPPKPKEPPNPYTQGEVEMLKLLRRIDRHLAKLAAA